MFARTPRLLLRPGWAEDAAALAAAINDETIVRNLASAPWPYGLDDARAFLSSWSDAPLPRFVMVQRTAAEPRLIGCIGIEAMAHGGTELGYWIARPFWGLGYATEAGRHMVDLARTLGIRQLAAGHFIDNPASGAVLRKLGFRATGAVTDRDSKGRGGRVKTVEYSLDIHVPANDGGKDDDAGDNSGDDPDGVFTRRWPSAMRDDWRQAAA